MHDPASKNESAAAAGWGWGGGVASAPAPAALLPPRRSACPALPCPACPAVHTPLPRTCTAAVKGMSEEVEQDGLAARLHSTKRALHVRRHLRAAGAGAVGAVGARWGRHVGAARGPGIWPVGARGQCQAGGSGRGRAGRAAAGCQVAAGQGQSCRSPRIRSPPAARPAPTCGSLHPCPPSPPHPPPPPPPPTCGSMHSLGSSSSTSTTGFKMRGT